MTAAVSWAKPGRGGLRRLAHHDELALLGVQGGVAGPDGVLPAQLGDDVVERLGERGVGGGEVGPLEGGVLLDLAVGGRVAAGHAEHVQAGELVLVGGGLTRTVDGRKGVELLGDGDGIGVGGHRIVVGPGGGEGDEVHVPAVQLVDLVEHRHVGLGGGEHLGVGAGRARDRRRQTARLGLVVDDVDGTTRHAARGGVAVGPREDGHAGRGVDGRHLQAARGVIAFGAPVVGGRLAHLGGRGVGERHRRMGDLPGAGGARRGGDGPIVLVRGGRHAGRDEGGDDEDDRPGSAQQAYRRPGSFGAGRRRARIRLGVAHGGSTSVAVGVVVVAPERERASGSEPRKASPTSGDSRTWRGGPLVSTAPWSMATRRSASSAMNAMSCSTTSKVAWSRSRTLRSRPTIASTSRWATPEEGSSRRTTEGWWATTAARSTRRREPVESSLTRLSA